MKVIIIGGVAGGASAAARLRRLDEKAEIIMLEKGPYISYANCGLPYYIGGVIEDQAELTLQTPESFRARFNVDVRVLNEAVAIDRVARTVQIRRVADGSTYTERYDRLILSPGASPVVPPLPGKDLPGVFTLRTVPDTLAIHSFIQTHKPRRAVVVGGGAIGLETAENLLEAGLKVDVVELSDHVIAPLDRDIAVFAHQRLRSAGIALHLETAVQGIEKAEKGLSVSLSNSQSLPCDLVLLSVGVRPDTPLAREAGLDLTPRGLIVVDETMRTSDPGIYAVGDAVQVKHFVSGEGAFLPLAGPANKQGRIAADNIAGLHSAYAGTQGSGIVKLFDMTAAFTGLNETQAKALGLPYEKLYAFGASHATYYPGADYQTIKLLYHRETGALLGAQLVGGQGVDKRCDVLATALRAGLTVADLKELELCYAPPYSSAKDPVNMLGFMADNIMGGRIRQYHWHDADSLPRDGSVVRLDVRTADEYAEGHFEGSVNIPLDELRGRMQELPKDKTLYVSCRSGQRSYIACMILTQNGFDCRNLAGGYRLYEAVTADAPARPAPDAPCRN